MTTEWFVNDLSIQGQFHDELQLKNALEPLLRLRNESEWFRKRLRCSRSLADREVAPGLKFHQFLARASKDFRQQVLLWVAKSGPFWDDSPEETTDNYFEYKSTDVTWQGLGEAARRCLKGGDARAFSFTGGKHPFDFTPLTIVQGLPEEPLERIDVVNQWLIDAVRQDLGNALPTVDWQTMMEKARASCPHLVFSGHILDLLAPHPFNRAVCRQVLTLLGVLETLCSERDREREWAFTDAGQRLLQDYFVGDNAKFSDESISNRQDFRQQLTFPDPGNRHLPSLFCPWHGKIYTQHYRIHFEWPIPVHQKEVKVVYIGPKITRH